MSAIEELLTNVDITSIIFYIFLFFFAFKGAVEVAEFFYGKLKGFFTTRSSEQNEIVDIKDSLDEILNEIALIKLSLEAYNEDIRDIKENIKTDEEHLLDEIRTTFKNQHHKYTELGMINDSTLDDLSKKFEYYTSKGGNGYVVTLFDDIKELQVVSDAEIYKRDNELRKEESTDD